MSGLLGVYRLDAAPVAQSELAAMAEPLRPYGPDGVGLWRSGPVGLGLTLLATTPELLAEPQPVVHAATGCAIAADVRLDNREELLAALGPEAEAVVGDAGLILAAYLAWGVEGVARLRGDFALALWDPRQQALLIARDPFGLRPLYYHWSAGRLFACASTVRSLLALPDVPRQINEARIADFLVLPLEGIDHTSTFFSAVYRLPPAHAALITPAGMRLWRYWAPEPQPELRLSSDDAYAEAFREVFTAAVRSRLRSVGPVGATLSGGLDSSSVTAVAGELLAEAGRGPLHTFSGVGPDPAGCPETRAIHAALAMPGLQPHLISYAELDRLMPQLSALSWDLEEPFDDSLTVMRAVAMLAQQAGVRVLLDGGAGDVLLGEGEAVARLLRRGRWLAAFRHLTGLRRFHRRRRWVAQELVRSARLAFTPAPLRRLRRRLLPPNWDKREAEAVRDSVISPHFAAQVRLGERLRQMYTCFGETEGLLSGGQELARALDHPYLASGRERYWRAVSPLGIEPRDPFLDRRMVDFCLALPDEQRAGSGWPKMLLRRAMAGRLPEALRWRVGKEHLGWNFTLALMALDRGRLEFELSVGMNTIVAYLHTGDARRVPWTSLDIGDLDEAETVWDIGHLAAWLRNWTDRSLWSHLC
ncbi:MAG: asparagine synthase-related protein [Anaerolineae bacterium]|nr:asparagine synthase-related protein [Anaerolineae bacterium]